MVYDKLPRGIRGHVSHSIRDLDRFAVPVEDTLETLRALAGPLFIGLDSEVRALQELIDELKRRWAYYEANEAWASSDEVLHQLPRASSSGHTELTKNNE